MEETLAMIAIGGEVDPSLITTPFIIIIDPINGKDSNGKTDGSKPFKTIAKLNSLLANTLIVGPNGSVTVLITSSPPPTDAELDLNIQYENGGNPSQPFATVFTLMGSTANVLHSGTLTVVSQINGATNTREVLSDPTVTDWTPFSARPIIVTAGPRQGNSVYTAIVDPTNVTVVPTDQPMTPFGDVDPAGLQTGDPYIVVDPVQVKLRQITFQGDGTALGIISDIRFPVWQASNQLNLNMMTNLDGPTNLQFNRCHFNGIVVAAGNEVQFTNCFLNLGFQSSASLQILDGVILPFLSIAPFVFTGAGAYYALATFGVGVNGVESAVFAAVSPVDQGVQFWDNSFGPSIGFTGGDVAVLGAFVFGMSVGGLTLAPTIGVEANGGGKLLLLDLFDTPSPIPSVMGTGFYLPGSNGTDTDFTLDDILTGAGDPVARSWQEAAGTYTGQIHASWANMAVAQPAGFGGDPTGAIKGTNAVSVASNSFIGAAPVGS